MPATREGGLKAAATNKERYGSDFYRRIGAIGGKISRDGGFAAATPEQRREWGRKGGKASKKRTTTEDINALKGEKENDQKFWKKLRHLSE